MRKVSIIDLALVRGNIPHGKALEIAQRLGIHKNTLSRKLHGTRTLSVEELNTIACILGIGVDKFLRMEDVEDSP